jgi:hypothetical protein
MNKRRLLTSIGLVLIGVLLVVSPAMASAVKTDFSGIVYPTGLIDPGDGFLAGKMEIWHGTIVTFAWETTDPRMTGYNSTVTLNSNFKIDPYYGREWGKWDLESDLCSWTGSYVGYHDQDDMIFLDGEGQGDCGGQVIQVRWEAQRYALSPDPAFAVTGYIIENNK